MNRWRCRRLAIALIGSTLSWVGAAGADEKSDLWRLEQELALLQREAEHLKERLAREQPQLEDWKRRLETVKPLVPAYAADVEDQLRRLAQEAGFESFAIRPVTAPERLAFPDGRPSPLEVRRLEISGRGGYARIPHFFLKAAHMKRVVSVESLRLETGTGAVVSFSARLALP